MVSTSSGSANCRYAIADGRLLKFAPGWSCSDARVIFDTQSGDYWVVSLLGSSLLRLFQTHGQMTVQAVSELIPGGQQRLATLTSTLQNLADHSLLQAVNCAASAKVFHTSAAD